LYDQAPRRAYRSAGGRIQLQFGPHGYQSSRAGSRKVEGTISGAVAWPTGSPSMRACTLIDLATVKRGRRSWAGVFAYLA
jgi:hypothetical protein